MRGPSSSKSFLLIHILKVLSDETVAPPTQQDHLRLRGAAKVMTASLGTSFCRDLWSLSLKPVNIVVPPATIIELYRVFRTSMSQFLIELMTISWTPGHSRPILSGLNKISGARYFSEPS